MKKLELNQDLKRQQVIKAYREAVSNQHHSFNDTILSAYDNTPDSIDFIRYYDYYDDNAFPFLYLIINNENRLFFGDCGTPHCDMMEDVYWYLVENGYSMYDITGNPELDKTRLDVNTSVKYVNDESNNPKFSIKGRYYLIDIPELNDKKCVVFAVWDMDKIEMSKINDVVYQISKKYNFFDREIFIANGRLPLIHYNEFTPGDEPEIEDTSVQKAIHLMNTREKHMATTGFRDTRDRMLGKKLTMSNGQEMPMAQYNALRRVDENIDPPETLENAISNNDEYYNTPDKILFGNHIYKWYNTKQAIPFCYLTFDHVDKLFIGDVGTNHFDLKTKYIKPYIIDNLGEHRWIYYYNSKDASNFLNKHTLYINIDGRVWTDVTLEEVPDKKFTIISFWELTDRDMIFGLTEMVCSQLGLLDTDIFIANGEEEYIPFNKQAQQTAEFTDNSSQYALHLMNARDKRMATTGYRAMRDEINGKKLGNMTQAEWNNMKYGYVAENVLKEQLIKEGGITQLEYLPQQYFECASRYYNNGELTNTNGDFLKKTCNTLNEIFKYMFVSYNNPGNLTLREMFKKYGKIVEKYKLSEKQTMLTESKHNNFDAAARTRYSISGEKLDKYCHVIDEVINEMDNNFNTNQVLTKESLTELCNDVELKDVMTSFDVQKQLNPKIWDENNHLNPRVRMRLIDIADKFYETLETSWVEPVDVIFTGSLCNYNWSKYSDIDLHIVVNFSELDSRTNFVKDYFDTKKKNWNNEHEYLTIYGFPVEVYVQDESEEHTASGIYSLYKDEWIVEPNPDDFSVEDLDRKMIANKVMKCADKIDELDELANNETDQHKIEMIGLKVKKLFTKIKSIRKNALKNGGEYTPGNIWFKALKRCGYLKKLIELKAKTFDKINTIK